MDWLIVGGGIHGTVIAHALLSQTRISPTQLLVVDRHREPLAAWDRRIDNCGMRFLRSPAAHGVVPQFTSLRQWAKRNGFSEHDFRPPYARPAVDLFRAHARWAVTRSGLQERFRQGVVTAIRRVPNAWVVVIDDTERVQTRHIVLAPGRSTTGGRPLLGRPAWAQGLPNVDHVLSDTFHLSLLLQAERPLIVGAGATAAHTAVTLARAGRAVTLLTRHEVRVHQFDSEPCFIGPRCYEEFLLETDPEERRRMISRARHPGSVPGDLAQELDQAQKAGRITIVRDEITAGEQTGTGVTLTGAAGLYQSDRIALATGFDSSTPAESLLRDVEQGSGQTLPRDSLQRPLTDPTLQWTPGVFLSGVLAEQELGPTAPNIIGAHNAAKRIVAHLAGRSQKMPRSWSRYADP